MSLGGCKSNAIVKIREKQSCGMSIKEQDINLSSTSALLKLKEIRGTQNVNN
jgi:hypothetical protein